MNRVCQLDKCGKSIPTSGSSWCKDTEEQNLVPPQGADRQKFSEIEGSRGQMMKIFECIAKQLGYYFLGGEQVE